MVFSETDVSKRNKNKTVQMTFVLWSVFIGMMMMMIPLPVMKMMIMGR